MAKTDKASKMIARSRPRAAASALAEEVERVLRPRSVIEALTYFWIKINNDWIFNLAGLLAYNILISIFPILLLLLALAGFLLDAISPVTLAQLQASIANALPAGVGGIVISAVAEHLRKSAGIVLAIGVISSLVAGSRLFITLESCLRVVFRLRGRDPFRQNIMAFGMLLLYIVLIPLIFFASVAPAAILHAFPLMLPRGVSDALLQIIGLIVALVATILFFGLIYIVVPNQPFHWHKVWRGTFAAAALLVLYVLIFPLYSRLFLRPDNYGSIAGFVIVVLIFFYYLAFIVLLGAEINSWAAGQRQTAADIPGVLHEVQAHNTTEGAAGPTAGLPHEDMQHHKGADAMDDLPSAIRHLRRDHRAPVPRHLFRRWRTGDDASHKG